LNSRAAYGFRPTPGPANLASKVVFWPFQVGQPSRVNGGAVLAILGICSYGGRDQAEFVATIKLVQSHNLTICHAHIYHCRDVVSTIVNDESNLEARPASIKDLQVWVAQLSRGSIDQLLPAFASDAPEASRALIYQCCRMIG
jgi:hypothetical protein